MRFLAFTLAAPLASFGAIAVGERRPSWDRPAKSAVLGLVAGALGVTRDDADAHRALADDFLYAVRVEDFDQRAPGRPFTDYHTAQTAPSKRGRRFATRRDELSVQDRETILTRRSTAPTAASRLCSGRNREHRSFPSTASRTHCARRNSHPISGVNPVR